MAKAKSITRPRKLGDTGIVLVILLVMIVIMATISPAFRTIDNMGNVIVQVMPLAIVSIGQTFVI